MSNAIAVLTDEEADHYRRAVCRIGEGRTAEFCVPLFVLEDLYVRREMSSEQIAKVLGASRKTIRFKLIRYGIDRRTLKEAFRVSSTHGESVSGKGPDSPFWLGRKMNQGYVMVYAPEHPDSAKYNGYVFEHRMVMEAALGRQLASGEEVHHDNEIRDDNRPENLVLLTRSDHMRLHANRRHRIGHPSFGFQKKAQP